MENLINILIEIFNPTEIFKQNEIITIIVDSEQKMEEKISKFSSLISDLDEEYSFRFLTKDETKNFNFKDLGVKIF
ncbi:MAG: hypothetical protein J7J43_06070 [Thermosipho sp. (in: Bacteria)]|nr:hypothetical protein [Thermosipho sp. (in: thermotogales)]MCD6105321.1 hypothetical protein [Thermosipho sp. (in: thermotogales)]